jgi:hypothetical protein
VLADKAPHLLRNQPRHDFPKIFRRLFQQLRPGGFLDLLMLQNAFVGPLEDSLMVIELDAPILDVLLQSRTLFVAEKSLQWMLRLPIR